MFHLDAEQFKRLAAWSREQDAKVAEQQKGKGFSSTPYYGCSGGSLTYSFTPTTLGLVVVVKNNITNEEINLTDYDNW
jgi:hypothetical protein